MGVTSRVCMSFGRVVMLVGMPHGVGVPSSLVVPLLLTLVQFAMGMTLVFGETEGESGIMRREGVMFAMAAAVSLSLVNGLSRLTVSIRGRTGRARRRFGSRKPMGVERGMCEAEVGGSCSEERGVLRSAASTSARQFSASSAHLCMMFGSIMNLAKLGWQTVSDEAGTEDWSQCPAEVPAESYADGTSTVVGHPVSLSCDGAAGNAEREFTQSLVETEDFVGLRLRVVARLEEGSNANKTDLVVPHHGVRLVRITR